MQTGGFVHFATCAKAKEDLMELEATFVCAYCFQVNTIMVDSTGGVEQEYVEDCQVCCRPNQLRITIDEELETVDVSTEAP